METMPVGREYTLVFTRDLKHPPAKVWAALTDPDQLDAWSPFRPDRDLGTTGPATLVMPEGATTATVTRVDPPHALEDRWDEDFLRWELEEIEGGTRLTLRHTTGGADMLPKLAAGWHICLDVADRLLDGHPVPVVRGEEAKKSGWRELHDAYAAELSKEEDA